MLVKMPPRENIGFAGIVPAIDPVKIPYTYAQTAQNCVLDGRTLAPWGSPTLEDASVGASTTRSIYKYRGDTDEWLTWDEDNICVVKSPINQDVYKRIYWTGEDDKLKVRGAFTPTATRDVALDTPSSAPTCALADQYAESYGGRTAITTDSGTHYASMTLQSVVETDVGYDITCAMAEEVHVSTTEPTLSFQLNTTAKGWVSYPGIGVKTAIVDGSVTFAEEQLTAIIGATYASKTGTTYTWDSRQVVFHINMNYKLQTHETIYYLLTYVDDLGQESPPSVVSSSYLRHAEQRATITMPVSSDSFIEKKRLYRSANSSSLTSGFYFVTEEDNATTTYIDWNRSEDLVETLSIHDNPVDGMQGLVMMAGAFALAYKDRTLYASEQNNISSWLPEYEIVLDADIKALSVVGNECYVMTADQPFLITGATPDVLTSSKLVINQSCVTNNRGVATVASRTIYPSPDGLVTLSGGQGVLTTEDYIQPRDWYQYNPDTLTCETYNNKLFAFSDNQFFVFDFTEGLKTITTLNVSMLSMFYDSIDDKLYFIEGTTNDLFSFDTNKIALLQLTWKSKKFWEVKPWRPSVVRVETDGNDAILRLYANNVLVSTLNIANDKARKIPKLRAEQQWEFEILSTSEIRDIRIADNMGQVVK